MNTCTFGVIACAVLRLEVQTLLPPGAHCHFLDQSLHNTPQELHRGLQAALTELEESAPQMKMIALAYGLCSKVVEGLRTCRCRLAIPRAHDCITLLLGSRQEYARYIAAFPGTYWYSPGWIATGTQPGPDRYEETYQSYLERFDEDDAQYLMETEQSWLREYTRACYVDIGVGDRPTGEAYTAACADWLNWAYDSQRGDPALLRDLLTGNWDEERFLILEPGETAIQSVDEHILKKAGG